MEGAGKCRSLGYTAQGLLYLCYSSHWTMKKQESGPLERPGPCSWVFAQTLLHKGPTGNLVSKLPELPGKPSQVHQDVTQKSHLCAAFPLPLGRLSHATLVAPQPVMCPSAGHLGR